MGKVYYVYAWIREDYGTPFYIGKGKTDKEKHYNRAKRVKENKHFKHIYNKIPTHYIILQDGLTEYEALELEKQIILFLVIKCGYSIECDKDNKKEIKGRHLVNHTLGGEGVSGYKHTKEEIERSTHHGENNPMYGKRGELSPHFNIPKSEEHKNKIRLNNPKRKSVKCIELNIVANSYREMSKILYEEYDIICSHASISSNCRNKIKYCGRDKNDNDLFLHFIQIDNYTDND